MPHLHHGGSLKSRKSSPSSSSPPPPADPRLLHFHGGKGEYLHRFLTRPTFLLLLMGCIHPLTWQIPCPLDSLCLSRYACCIRSLFDTAALGDWLSDYIPITFQAIMTTTSYDQPPSSWHHFDIYTKRLAAYWHDHTTYSCPQIMEPPPPKPDRAQKSLAELFYLICCYHRLSTQSRRTLRTTRAWCWPFTLSHCRG